MFKRRLRCYWMKATVPPQDKGCKFQIQRKKQKDKIFTNTLMLKRDAQFFVFQSLHLNNILAKILKILHVIAAKKGQWVIVQSNFPSTEMKRRKSNASKNSVFLFCFTVVHSVPSAKIWFLMFLFLLVCMQNYHFTRNYTSHVAKCVLLKISNQNDTFVKPLSSLSFHAF